MPRPVVEQSPEIKDGKLKIPCPYNSVSNTLAAQFGINPITADRIGWKMEFFKSKDANLVNPIPSKSRFNPKLNIKIKKYKFNACCKACKNRLWLWL